MKRIFVFLISLAILLSLVGCSSNSSWQAEKASSEVIPYAKRAIEIIDNYLNFVYTVDELEDAFEELDGRIDLLDITYDSKIYNSADYIINSCITSLSYGHPKTDSKYREFRDLLAFQISEEVSGKVYQAPRNDQSTEEDALKEIINVNVTPFDYGDIHYFNNYVLISLSFDSRHGVSIADLGDYTQKLLDKLSQLNLTSATIHVRYNSYDQSIFYLALQTSSNLFYGEVFRNDSVSDNAWEQLEEEYSEEEIANMDELPSKYSALNPLYSMESIDDLENAIAAAQDFAGMP